MKYLFTTIIRNFTRKPVTNLINLLGLAVSLALVIILSVYSYSELTTDNYHKNGDRVFLYGALNKGIYTPAILKEQIDLSVPGVESTVRMAAAWEAPVFQVGNNDPITSDILFADEDFFKLFTYITVEGNLESALKEPMSVVITKTLSGKLFGSKPAVGRTMKMNNNHLLTIRAVIEEPKANSCISFSAISSVRTRKVILANEGEFTDWGWCNYQTFILLKPGTNPDETAKKITALFPQTVQREFVEAKLNPLRQLYLSKSNLSSATYFHQGDKRKIMFLVLVAALVLMIALVNFINISSSQWLDKIKQTGVMKIMGAKPSTILFNILSEAFLLFLMALLIAIMIVILIDPYIQNSTGIKFNPQFIYAPGFLIISIAGVFVLSFLFSIIPAMRISKSNAIDNLKKTVEAPVLNQLFSGTLVTAQFVIAIVLLAFTILVQKQVTFGSSNLGCNQENIIGIKLTPQLNTKKEVLKQLLQKKPIIEKISFTQYYPGKPISHWGVNYEVNGERKTLDLDLFNADPAFFGMLGLQLKLGRFYSDDLKTDVRKIVVNETFLRKNKIENPIGLKFVLGMDMAGGLAEIIGVVKDFRYKPVNEPIPSLVIQNGPDASYCLVSMHTSDFNSLHQAIHEINDLGSSLSPSFPVEVSFFDQAIEDMYKSELLFRRTFSLFAGCAIIICCMGILAMSLFGCQRRVKEIGIRKINGAGIWEVLFMLNKDFVKWIAIAFVIATPVAYYIMQQWLEAFAYKTGLSWWIFAAAGITVFLIVCITVTSQSWRAASCNPVESIRHE